MLCDYRSGVLQPLGTFALSAGCGKTELVRFAANFLGYEFLLLKLHGGSTVAEIVAMCRRANQTKHCHVVLFWDGRDRLEKRPSQSASDRGDVFTGDRCVRGGAPKNNTHFAELSRRWALAVHVHDVVYCSLRHVANV